VGSAPGCTSPLQQILINWHDNKMKKVILFGATGHLGKAIARELVNEIVQSEIDKDEKLKTIPIGLFQTLLPVLKLCSKNTF
jgi:hypothetical protein